MLILKKTVGTEITGRRRIQFIDVDVTYVNIKRTGVMNDDVKSTNDDHKFVTSHRLQQSLDENFKYSITSKRKRTL